MELVTSNRVDCIGTASCCLKCRCDEGIGQPTNPKSNCHHDNCHGATMELSSRDLKIVMMTIFGGSKFAKQDTEDADVFFEPQMHADERGWGALFLLYQVAILATTYCDGGPSDTTTSYSQMTK
jgi:hypothetical protein